MIERFTAAYAAYLNPELINSKKNLKEDFLNKVGNNYKTHKNRWERIRQSVQQALQQAELQSGNMLEIGGRKNPRDKEFSSFSYNALDISKLKDSNVPIVIGDITNCPEIQDNSYDFVFSVDVFEHIDKPWLAGQEIERILKPGGVTFHSTLFAWRHHPCPIDFWRFSPDALASLFPKLKTLVKEFDYSERRRNMIGRGKSEAPIDELGGWRENVRVNYAGTKPK